MTDPAPPAQALPRILLADESEISAAVIARHLEGKFEILHCRDGTDAWHLLDNTPAIEVVIIDMQLPRLSARELLAKIRTSTATRLREVPVLAMTGSADNTAREVAYGGGASDFIAKPVDALELVARVGVHQKLAQTIRELQFSRQQLQEQATTDVLTDLKNRRGFVELGVRQFALAQRHDTELSIIILDIDHFKKINDTYGHPAGDQVLVRVAQVLRGKTRIGDVPARIGGEEFAILLPSTKRAGAALLADRIRVAIQEAEHLLDGRPVGGVTASAGVAAYGLDSEESLEHLVEVADKRLYLAKQRGRNRVIAMN
jgi:two-component system, chemotaxis family, response regulator WspR